MVLRLDSLPLPQTGTAFLGSTLALPTHQYTLMASAASVSGSAHSWLNAVACSSPASGGRACADDSHSQSSVSAPQQTPFGSRYSTTRSQGKHGMKQATGQNLVQTRFERAICIERREVGRRRVRV